MTIKYNFLHVIFVLATIAMLFSGCTQQTSAPSPAPQPETMPSVAPIQASEPTAAPTPTEPVPEIAKEFLTYENSDAGVKIKYPTDWKKLEQVSPEVIVAFFAPVEREIGGSSFIVATEDISANPMALEKYTEYSIAQLEKQTMDFKLVESKPTTVSGRVGHKIVFTGKSNNQPIKAMAIWAVKNDGTYYNILFTAKSDAYTILLGTITEMIDSLEISETVAEEAQKFLEYASPPDRIKIKYPADWGVSERRDDYNNFYVIFSRNEPNKEVSALFFHITVDKDFTSFDVDTMDEYTQSELEFIEDFTKDLTIIESGATKLDGLKAHKVVYTGKSGTSYDRWYMEIWAFKNKDVYTLKAYTKKEDADFYTDIVNEMVNSFEFT